MVTHPGTAPSADPLYRPLNLPRATTVHTDDGGRPQAIAPRPECADRLAPVAELLDVWEIDDEWWRPQPIARRYFRLLLGNGQTVTAFCEQGSGQWFLQNY